MPEPLLQVNGLVKTYAATSAFSFRQSGGSGGVRAVDDVTFSVQPAETFGLVGESGCGKTTVARCILRLIAPTRGEIRFHGQDLLAVKPEALRKVRRELQIIFQDPYSSLDPRMTIRATLLEPLQIHRIGNRTTQEQRVRELLDLVGLPDSALSKFPHEFSGGQRQRIGIARALALSPRLVVADEPVSALDLSIRAQVINLMADLQEQLGLAYLLIAHDLTLVRHVCHQVAVMRRGRIVELAGTDALFSDPLHPYTQQLLEAIPIPDPDARKRQRESESETAAGLTRVGEISDPHPAKPASAPMDSSTLPSSSDDDPPLREVKPGHWARI